MRTAVFKVGTLRPVFGPETEEVAGGWEENRLTMYIVFFIFKYFY
jgi:hypothetical protein